MAAPDDTAASHGDDLKRLWRATLSHMLANMEAPPGSLNAAQLAASLKFLADNGVSVSTLEGLDRVDPAKHAAELADKLAGYDGDNPA